MGRYGHGYGVVERRKSGCRIHELLGKSDLYVISLFLFLPSTVLVLCCMLLTHTTLPMLLRCFFCV